MSEIREQLPQIHKLVVIARDALDVDPYTSAAFIATVEEFLRKSQKAMRSLPGADDSALWELVVELEQAGDSAKMAAWADKGIRSESRKAVLDAHEAICRLKIEQLATRPH
ncbi:MAG: hypothetical protein HY900_25710 [Deltaproteobacteria bacterium]|nr:hypothetical protein [Deltaproteobacteria bacterium]